MPELSNSIAVSNERLLSLDALRGFDMCWILGLAGVVTKVLAWVFPRNPSAANLAMQFEHVDWEGFRFYDLIFPLFLFLAGVSMAIALPRRVAREGRRKAVGHLLARAAVLVALGIVYSGGVKEGWEQVRWLGVLQRIGIASAAAGLLSLWLGARGLTVAAVTLLIFYFWLLRCVPVPDVGTGYFAEGVNLTNYLDSLWLPGRKYDGDHDPEGILSTLPAIATAVLGILAGKWLTGNARPMRKVVGLIVAGAVMVALGWAWHPLFPVIKKIWSSSFVLVAGGWSAVLLGVFYWVVDVRGWRSGLEPLLWVGANPIALYLCAGFGFFRTVSTRLMFETPAAYGWMGATMTFLVMLVCARWMYRRKIFLRV